MRHRDLLDEVRTQPAGRRRADSSPTGRPRRPPDRVGAFFREGSVGRRLKVFSTVVRVRLASMLIVVAVGTVNFSGMAEFSIDSGLVVEMDVSLVLRLSKDVELSEIMLLVVVEWVDIDGLKVVVISVMMMWSTVFGFVV